MPTSYYALETGQEGDYVVIEKIDNGPGNVEHHIIAKVRGGRGAEKGVGWSAMVLANAVVEKLNERIRGEVYPGASSGSAS